MQQIEHRFCMKKDMEKCDVEGVKRIEEDVKMYLKRQLSAHRKLAKTPNCHDSVAGKRKRRGDRKTKTNHHRANKIME